ncbi:hypothetical protein [Mucilaginibacter pineti]|nr:hypothetical protein [Mucilaginibacter pineti]
MEITKYSKPRKVILITGIITAVINLLVIYPLMHSTASYITDYNWLFVSLGGSVLLLLYGLTGPRFFQYLLFTFLSTIFCAVSLFVYSIWDSWMGFLVLLIGIPSGIVTALVFFILRYVLFFRNKSRPVEKAQKNKLLLKQIVLYIFLAAIILILFIKGGDWWFDLFEQ